MSKLLNVVKNDDVKKTECDELVKNVDTFQNTNTSDLVKKLTLTQKLMKLLIMIMINILLLKNLIS